MCSASTSVAGHSASWPGTRSCHQMSRPSAISTSASTRLTTRTFSTEGDSARAVSAICLRGTTDPLRQAPSQVMSTLASASLIRSRSESGENPPKTTEWAAPRRAQAIMAMGSSGTMPM